MLKEVKILNKVLKGVKTIQWTDTDPWVEVQIPFGDIRYQHLKGREVNIKLECYDWDSLYEIFFNTDIGDGKYIVDPVTWRKNVFSTNGDQFIVKVRTLSGEYTFKFYECRVRTISPAEIQSVEDELTYEINITAKRVERVIS